MSAAKFLHTLMMQQSETVEPDPWAAVAASISESNEDADNLSQNPDFGKMNGHGQPKHDLRPMRQAAMAGDHFAARALLRLYGFDEIAAEIKRNLPFSNRVRRQVLALTAGIDTEWEADLLRVDLPPRRRTRPIVFEDEENDDATPRSRG